MFCSLEDQRQILPRLTSFALLVRSATLDPRLALEVCADMDKGSTIMALLLNRRRRRRVVISV